MLSAEFKILEIIVLIIFFVAIQKNKLTLGGAFSALFVGTIVSLPGFEYLTIMAAFFFSSIKATDIHKQIKIKQLGKSYLRDKKRNHVQVLCKSIVPSAVCLIIYLKFQKQGIYLFSPNKNYLKIFLDGIFIGFFESANADTWASELGIASKDQPVLILSGFQKVPKGINGAVSKYGTWCSIKGGMFISLITVICTIFRFGLIAFFKEFKIGYFIQILKIIICGGITGFLGSFIDSLLGETIQISIYNETKQCVIEKEVEKEDIKKGDKLKYYGKDILGNSGVNLVTGIITSFISAYIMYKLI